ncbi:MAG: DUF4260 domain-containing protein [Chryseolinea sp.]
MKNQLKAEEALQFLATIYLVYQLPVPGWLYWALLIVPDLSMLGYLVSARIGAISYNVVHHKGIAVAIYLIGLYLSNTELLFAGLLLYCHSSMDRLSGYGLKYPDSFRNTHLGMIGKP